MNRSAARLLQLVGLAIVACADPVAPGKTIGESGTLTFTYTGAGAAAATTYNAVGAVPLDAANGTGFGTTPWATGTVFTAQNELSIASAVPVGSATWDVALLSIAGIATGTRTIDGSCATTPCTNVDLTFGSNQGSASFAYSCLVTTGTMNVTQSGTRHAAGTFSGTGVCVTKAGASSAFSVTNGSFAVETSTISGGAH